MLKLTPAASQGHPNKSALTPGQSPGPGFRPREGNLPGVIKNIIFDFGGVICNIDFKLSELKFKELGFKGFTPSYSVEDGEDVFRRLESGKISTPEFISGLKKHLNPGVSDQEVLNAWNAMILDIPPLRVRLLEEVRKSYRIFILSNSNEIHFHNYLRDFTTHYGYRSFEDVFEKTWFSFRIHLQKPSREIFEYVIGDADLVASETLFIDDSIQHIEAAANVGLRTYHLQAYEEITDLFEPAP